MQAHMLQGNYNIWDNVIATSRLITQSGVNQS